MPKNCSTNFVNIIDKVDATIFSGNRTAIDALKVKFGLAELSHDDDFARQAQRSSPREKGRFAC